MNTLLESISKKFDLKQQDIYSIIEEIDKGKSLIDSLLDANIIDESNLYRYLSKNFRMPYKEVSVNLSSEELINKINISYLKTNLIFPFSRIEGKIEVLIYDPYKVMDVSSLHDYCDEEIEVYLTSRSNLLSLIDFAEHKKRRKDAIIELNKGVALGQLFY